MTYGQLFMILNPNVKVVENGTCVWIYFDSVNHDTFRAEWWNKEIPDEALKAKEATNTNVGKLISVEEMMPKRDVDVLTYFRWGAFEIGRFDKDPDSLEYRWKFEDFDLYGDDMQDVTHWMPLPEPPKEG